MDRNRVKARDVAARIPLDYYKHPDPVFMKKTWLWKGAAIAAVVWIFTMFAPGKVPVVGSNRFSHGPVCRVHSAFEHECSACHVSFPMLGSKDSSGAFKGDARCMECHLGHGEATHSPLQKVAMTPNCGVCHTDHKGRNFNLKRVNDKDCNVCHKDLQASMDGGQCKFTNSVTSFPDPDKHPSFKSATKDPSTIKFNHKYHMTTGIVLTEGGKQFTLADMAAGPMKTAFQGRGVAANAPISLQCADCHTLQEKETLAGAPPTSDDPLSDAAKKANSDYFSRRMDPKTRGLTLTGELRPPHTAGAYMAPINYEDHCAACHGLKFDANLPAVSHKQPGPQDEQLKLLRAEVTRLIGDSKPEVKQPPLGLPGKSPHVGGSDRVEAAMRSLLEGKRVCGECHTEPSGSDLTVNSTRIALSNIPTEWFQYARFKHRPHEFVDCRSCHAQAYADRGGDDKGLLENYAKPRKGAEDVMIPNIDNCRQCHTPKPTLSTPTPARYDCTECHGYHNGKGSAGK
jgi:hypothetical protein